jgi:hypothetical protein
MKTTIDMAREAGGRAQQNKNCDVEYLMSADALKAFEALVRADEREACAKVCEEEICNCCWDDDAQAAAEHLAAAIRARGNT